MKRVVSIFVVLSMLLFLIGCEKEVQPVKIMFQKGSISAYNDKAFTLNLEAAEGAPNIGQVNVKAGPDDSVTVAGKGFTDENLKVFICDMASGKTVESNYTVVDDNLMAVTIDKDFNDSIFAVYAQNQNGFSNWKLINAPRIWSVNFTKLTANEEFCIYGENFIVDKNKKPKVYLVTKDGFYEPELLYTDPYKIAVKTPDTLKDGETYEIYLYNGVCGKNGVCKAEQKITYTEKPAVSFDGKKINVTDFGADARDIQNDDTKAIKAAVDAAQSGDTIYFPKGYYLINEDIEIDESVKLLGDGSEESIILSGNGLEKTTFNVIVVPFEVTKLGFEQKRTLGKVKTTFFNMKGDYFENGTWSIYVHDCRFVQNSSKEYISRVFPMDITGCKGVRIENNTLDTFGFLTGRNIDNTIIKNNKFDSNFITGYYYGQDSFSISSADTIDISNNIIQGKDAKKDNALDYNNYTAGRCIVFNVVTNAYLGNNTLRKAGIPHCNAGEMFLLENLNVQYDGPIASADENSFTLPKNSTVQFSKDDIVSVVSGEGVYQYRTVVSAKGMTAYLDTPFDVIPDESSRVIISHCFSNIAIYNNLFDGHTTWAEYPGATTSLQAYGSVHNLFMEKNTLKDMPEGICITPYYYNPTENTSKAVISWCVFDENVFYRNGVGIRYYTVADPNTGPIPACVSFGVAIRRNTFKEIPEYTHTDWIGEGGYAIQMGTLTKQATGDRWQGDWTNGVIIENNNFNHSETADLSLGSHQNNILTRGNTKDFTIKIHENGNNAVSMDY